MINVFSPFDRIEIKSCVLFTLAAIRRWYPQSTRCTESAVITVGNGSNPSVSLKLMADTDSLRICFEYTHKHLGGSLPAMCCKVLGSVAGMT